MFREIILILARVIVGLLIATVTLYFFIILPHDKALHNIDQLTNGVSDYMRAIESGITKVGELPGVTVIKPQTLGSARGYIQRLDSLLPNFNVSQTPAPEAQTPVWRNRRIDFYNELIKTNSFSEKIASSYTDLKTTYNFLTHHRLVLYTIANLLEYSPDTETKGSQEVVWGKLEEAGNALAKIISQLETLGGDHDKTLGGIVAAVKEFNEARELLARDVSSATSTSASRAHYIATVTSIQRQILANRQAFWASQKKVILDILKAASAKLTPINAGLQNLD